MRNCPTVGLVEVLARLSTGRGHGALAGLSQDQCSVSKGPGFYGLLAGEDQKLCGV